MAAASGVTGNPSRWFATLLAFLACACGANGAVSSDGWPLLAGRLRLVGNSSDLEGVVETFIYDGWRTVCGQNWTLGPAHAVCRLLGHSGGAAEARAMPTPEALLGEPALTFVDLVTCVGEGVEGQVMDCDDFESSGDGWCDLSEVAWVRCLPEPVERFSMTEALNMDSEPAPAGVQPVVTDVGGGSVTLDWTEWKMQIADSSLFLVRFNIKYRVADNDASAEYAVTTDLPSSMTRHTIRGLDERTKYEFIVQAIKLGPHGEEPGPSTQPLVVYVPCGAPSQVSNATVWPRNSTGRVLELSWERPSAGLDCPPTSYLVEFHQESLGQCGDDIAVPDYADHVDSVSLAGSTPLTHFTLGGLQPHSTYTVFVTSRNEHGTSPKWQGTAMTNEDVPSAAPTGIRSEYVDETTLRFSWDPIPCGDRGGVITGYAYMLLDATTDAVTHSERTEQTSVVLRGVLAVRRYKFLVAARTAVGSGPYAAFSVDAKPKIQDICGRIAPYDSSSDPRSHVVNQKIVSGTTARKGSSPWLAQLWYVDKGTLFCHGSILNNRWILTAAHCIRKRNATKDHIMVRLGDFDKNLPEEEEQVYHVEDIRVHNNFDTKLFDADVALIRVTRPIQFTDYVRPICVPPKPLARNMLTVGTRGVVHGWGKVTSRDDEYPRYLKKVTLPVKDQSTCRRSTKYDVTPNMFCAGYSREGMGDSCEGDSGAPFLVQHENSRWYVLGIVSWGEGCDRMDKFGFYVRLHRYTAWIRKHTGIKFS